MNSQENEDAKEALVQEVKARTTKQTHHDEVKEREGAQTRIRTQLGQLRQRASTRQQDAVEVVAKEMEKEEANN